MISLQAFANFDTSTKIQVDGLYYYLDNDNLQAQVTWMPDGKYTGNITIPADITYERKTYSVTNIGEDTFRKCSSLTSVTIPNSVTSIESGAFYRCSGLTSVIIPNSMTHIESGAFSGCSGLTSIKVESDNPNYDSRDNCNAIIQTSINSLYVGCKNTVIPNSVTSIGMGAFGGCSGLTSIIIPNSVTKIGDDAFKGCTGLVSVTIGNNVTTMGYYVFYECSNLTSVTVLNPTPVSISEGYTFTNRKKATLYVPIGSKSAYQAADIWKDFKEIIEIDPAKIEQIMNDEKSQATIFTLDGKRIHTPQKGINIIGGKMILIK